MSAEETKQASAPASTKKVATKKTRATKKTAAPPSSRAQKAAPQSTSPRAPAATKKKVVSKPAAKPTPATTRTSAAKPTAVPQAKHKVITLEKRNEMIATMAYHLSEQRGFEPGWELEDWLESERVVDRLLASKHVSIGKK